MDPMLLIGLFFGGGILFIGLFVVVMLVTGHGKGRKPSKHHDPQRNLPNQNDWGG